MGTGVETTVNGLYDLVADACGTPRPARHGPAKSGEQLRSVLDVTKSRTALGLTGLVPLPDGLSRTAAWFRKAALRPDARMLARPARTVAGALRSRRITTAVCRPPGGAVRPRARRVDDALDDLARRLASRLHEKALQAGRAELAPLRVVRLDDAVRVEKDHVARLHVNRPAAVDRIGRGPEDHPRRLQLAERAARGVQMQGRRMAGVHVDDVAVRLELAVEQRHELRRETALVQDAVQSLDRAGDLEVAADSHAQTHVDVAHEKRREEAVPRGVRDRRAEAQIAEGQEVVEVAADGLGGKREPVEVVVPHLRHRSAEGSTAGCAARPG